MSKRTKRDERLPAEKKTSSDMPDRVAVDDILECIVEIVRCLSPEIRARLLPLARSGGSMNIETTSARRAIIYAWVSTDEQAEKGYSLPTQLDVCRNTQGRTGTPFWLRSLTITRARN